MTIALLGLLLFLAGWIIKLLRNIMATFADIQSGIQKIASDVDNIKTLPAGSVAVAQTDIDSAVQSLADVSAKIEAIQTA